MTNLVHGFIYFAGSEWEFDALGLPADHHYLRAAGRHSGRSPPGIVATFYNFNPALVAAVIPAAWSFADPTKIERIERRGELSAGSSRISMPNSSPRPRTSSR